MKEERLKQALTGERGWDRKNYYGSPVDRDSYTSGPHSPH